MIGAGGARITVTLEGEAGPVELVTRPVDLFAAEAELGFDPLTELTTTATVGAVSSRVLRGLCGLAWAAYRRTSGKDMSLDVFLAALEVIPTVGDPEDTDVRPTPAAVSTA